MLSDGIDDPLVLRRADQSVPGGIRPHSRPSSSMWAAVGPTSRPSTRTGLRAQEALALEVSANSVGRDTPGVVRRGAQDHDLGGYAVEHPAKVLVAQAVTGVLCGDDDAIEVLVF